MGRDVTISSLFLINQKTHRNMLLLNGKQFIPTSNDKETLIQRNHYKEAIAYLRKEYGQGGRNNVITLVRRKEQKVNASGHLEETAPMVFPAKSTPEIQFSRADEKHKDNIGGMEIWAYSGNRPKRANVGDDYQPDPKSIKFISHAQGFNMDTDMDLIYFLLYKSPKVYFQPAIAQGKVKRGDLIIDDPARKAKDKVRKERDILKLKNAVMAPEPTYPLYSDENLRKVAAAWGLSSAMDEFYSADTLRIQLEHAVKEGEKTKEKIGRGKGLAEFFEMCNFDESVRKRAVIMFAIDAGLVVYDLAGHNYYYKSSKDVIVDVPAKHRADRFDYLSGHLENKINEKDWDLFKKEVINDEYLDKLSFGDLKWLAQQDHMSVSQKSTDTLREELSEIYCG